MTVFGVTRKSVAAAPASLSLGAPTTSLTRYFESALDAELSEGAERTMEEEWLWGEGT